MQTDERSVRALAGLEPQRLWNYFHEISCIPRESGNEEGVRSYLLAFAKEHQLETFVDATGNVIMRKPATAGMELVPSVALQGHMDMVCVKEEHSTHDFLRDPIVLQRNGDWLSAVGTTLGADNGIALALMLDILSDPQAKHGPLEAICTVAEETGLFGAFGLDPGQIHSRRLINLDSEEEGVLYIGCAGGIEVEAVLPLVSEEVPSNHETWELAVNGLKGGHSGADADKQLANAISCTARFFATLPQSVSYRIAGINGGTKRNVIPSVCKAIFTVGTHDRDAIIRTAAKVQEDLRFEYRIQDPQILVSVRRIEDKPAMVADEAQSKALMRALFIAPTGVDKMSTTMQGLVETSSNLAVVTTSGSHFKMVSSHRSSVLASRDHSAARSAAALGTCGASTTILNGYPAWTPDPDSRLARICTEAWKNMTGSDLEVTAIHAGLECGIINSLVPGMDSVSLGPDLHEVHSVTERVSVSSTARIAAFLRHLLEHMA